MKHTVKYVNEKYKDEPIGYSITTNGTLVNDEIIQFFKDNKVAVLVSIDGPDNEFNVRHYKDGTKSINDVLKNIKKFQEAKVPIELRATLLNINPYICQTFQFFEEMKVPFSIIFAFSSENTSHHYADYDENTMSSIEKQMEDLYLYYAKKVRNHEMIYNKRCSEIMNILRYRVKRNLSCAAGRTTFTITSKGDIFSCAHFMNNKDRIIGKMIGKQIDKPYNKIRRQYGLGPMKNGDELRSDKLNLIPISKYVVERSPYWEDINILTGYWYGEEPEYIPDSKLSDFIEAGEKPAILALGAMSFEDRADKAKLDMFVNSFQKTGCRAVIQGFQKTLQDYDLPDTVIACGNVPHSWLFRQGSFVIHHCGFGTTAASIIYGIPSIPVPHVLDQLGFAMQLEKCGVATTHIDAKDLSEEKIVKAIEEMKKDCHIKKHNAEMISEKIRTEGGVDEAVRQIIRITGETDLRKQFR